MLFSSSTPHFCQIPELILKCWVWTKRRQSQSDRVQRWQARQRQRGAAPGAPFTLADLRARCKSASHSRTSSEQTNLPNTQIRKFNMRLHVNRISRYGWKFGTLTDWIITLNTKRSRQKCLPKGGGGATWNPSLADKAPDMPLHGTRLCPKTWVKSTRGSYVFFLQLPRCLQLLQN